jgi:histidyl-tRNA synthetase
MGYYTGAVFEVAHPEYSFSLGGGGRYDNMVGRFLGRQVSACGFSVGFERLMLALSDEDILGNSANECVVIIYDGAETILEAYKMAQSLRDQGAQVTVLPREKKVSRQIQRLRELGSGKILLAEKGGIRDAA